MPNNKIENKSKKQSKKQADDIEAIKSVLGNNYHPKIKTHKKTNIENIFIKKGKKNKIK